MSSLSEDEAPETSSKEKKKKKKHRVEVSRVVQTHFLQRFDANDNGRKRANSFRV
jgi:hypothetical protein